MDPISEQIRSLIQATETLLGPDAAFTITIHLAAAELESKKLGSVILALSEAED